MLLQVLFCVFLLFILVFARPDLWYSHHYEYRQFRIHTNEPLEEGWEQDADKAIRISSSCPWHDSAYIHNVYLIPGGPHHWLFAFMHRQVDGVNIPLLDAYFMRDNRIKARSVGHEMVHTWQERHLGFWKYVCLEGWIREGYAYYLEIPPRRNLELSREEQEQLLELNDSKACLGYLLQRYREEVVVGYLLDHEGLSPEEVHSPEDYDFCRAE